MTASSEQVLFGQQGDRSALEGKPLLHIGTHRDYLIPRETGRLEHLEGTLQAAVALGRGHDASALTVQPSGLGGQCRGAVVRGAVPGAHAQVDSL